MGLYIIFRWKWNWTTCIWLMILIIARFSITMLWYYIAFSSTRKQSKSYQKCSNLSNHWVSGRRLVTHGNRLNNVMLCANVGGFRRLVFFFQNQSLFRVRTFHCFVALCTCWVSRIWCHNSMIRNAAFICFQRNSPRKLCFCLLICIWLLNRCAMQLMSRKLNLANVNVWQQGNYY